MRSRSGWSHNAIDFATFGIYGLRVPLFLDVPKHPDYLENIVNTDVYDVAIETPRDMDSTKQGHPESVHLAHLCRRHQSVRARSKVHCQ
jgi:hypothetical protein